MYTNELRFSVKLWIAKGVIHKITHKHFHCGYPVLVRDEYLTIIPRARVGYEMTDSQQGA